MASGDDYIEFAAVEKLRYALKVKQVSDELLEELTSSLQWLLHYSEKYNIPLPENDKIIGLIDRVIAIEERLPADLPNSHGDFNTGSQHGDDSTESDIWIAGNVQAATHDNRLIVKT